MAIAPPGGHTQTGAVFGTTRYGNATYGNPAGPGALPMYSASPFVANTVSYQTIQLSWSKPTLGDTIRLLRNGRSEPTDQNDGMILQIQDIGGTSRFTDRTLDASAEGQIYYYALWVLDGAGNWWFSGATQAMVPGQWHYGKRMFDLLPQWYRTLDHDIYTGRWW